ncbi:lysostaphin resistance A-like protein [Silvibacterium sp.]|uniref:CPBP family intramembrane glutamic endopeptidase n=1 Tax=Silvibacterium sp. TaxID=1964179 RepID=UPI0039E26DFF
MTPPLEDDPQAHTTWEPGSWEPVQSSFPASSVPDPPLAPEFVPEPPAFLTETHRPRLIPHLGHTVLFFVLAFIALLIGQGLGLFLIKQFHIFGHKTLNELAAATQDDPRISLPVQGLSYALIALVVIPVFSVLWHEPFGAGIHWNASVARRRFLFLALGGLACGFSIAIFGNFLPMPKDPPIMQDMMHSPLGAWMMLIFGVTIAPLLEELAFRGFLLPGLVNGVRWLEREELISTTAARFIGVPAAVFVTSLGFAFMHSGQVSHAWGPLVLIGGVSIVLCIVRLTLDSLAASVIVHAAYNFTLFAGMIAATGGFRHLEKLTT